MFAGGCGKVRLLPNRYIELEYIEFTGTQYINTGIQPLNHKVEAKFQVSNTWDLSPVFGTETTNPEIYLHFTVRNNSYYYPVYGNERNFGIANTGIHTVIMNSGEQSSHFLDKNAFSTGSNTGSAGALSIGHRHDNAFLKGKIYSFKVTSRDTGLTIQDFIPCQNPDGVIGMYETLSQTFYANAGEGEFIAGPNLEYNENSFLAGVATGRQMKGWCYAPVYVGKTWFFGYFGDDVEECFGISYIVPETYCTKIHHQRQIVWTIPDLYADKFESHKYFYCKSMKPAFYSRG